VQLIGINDFRKRYFVSGHAPTSATVRKWIECGNIRGRKIGKLYYVDIDAWKHATGLDPLADKILDEFSR